MDVGLALAIAGGFPSGDGATGRKATFPLGLSLGPAAGRGLEGSDKPASGGLLRLARS